jgi:hypothetical protein
MRQDPGSRNPTGGGRTWATVSSEKTRSFGTIRQLSSGRWQARYRGPDSLLRSAPSTFVRKGDAARWLALTEAELLGGGWIDPDAGRVPFTGYAAAWISERAGLRPKTIQLYRYLLRRHLAPGFAAQTVAGITEADVRRWRADLLTSGVSPVMPLRHTGCSKQSWRPPPTTG